MPRVRNLFTDPDRLPLVAPSILSSDFARLADECAHVLRSEAEGGGDGDLLHIDVMDGHFVPNLTMGPALARSLGQALPEAFMDVHLMVTDPGQYIEPFAEAGANHLTFHVEPALDPHAGTGMAPLGEGYDAGALADRVREAGMTAGLAINPPTALTDQIIEIAGSFDLVLVMSVNPGFSGQSFIPSVLDKTRALRSRLGPEVRIEMDGGINTDTAPQVRAAGADVIVAASAVFGAKKADRARIIAELRG
jgi:ribulose-phosphate 3-epimerase